VRILGNTSLRLGPTILVAGKINWAQGILPITDQAFTAAAVPLPQIDEPGWLYQQAGFAFFPAIVNGGELDRVLPMDVKGQRRIPKAGNLLFHIMRNLGLINLEFQLHLRVLYRLP